MKYDYEKLYNEHWAKAMEDDFKHITCIGITSYSNEDIKNFGFHNVFADDASPYDYCARIGMTILRALNSKGVEYLNVSEGSYIFGCKSDQQISII